MKALQIKSKVVYSQEYSYTEVGRPITLANQVLIEVKAARLINIQNQQIPSLIVELSGVVVEVGEKVNHLAPKDLVYACISRSKLNTLSPLMAINASFVSKKPGNLTFVEAATLPFVGMALMNSLGNGLLATGKNKVILGNKFGAGNIVAQFLHDKSVPFIDVRNTIDSFSTNDVDAIFIATDYLPLDVLLDLAEYKGLIINMFGAKLNSDLGIEMDSNKILGSNVDMKTVNVESSSNQLEELKFHIENEFFVPQVEEILSFGSTELMNKLNHPDFVNKNVVLEFNR